jgi:hypothetical protein
MIGRHLRPLVGLCALVLAASPTGVVTAERSAPASPDFSGVWMPTAIGPDGQRNLSWPQHPPFLPAVQKAYDAYLVNKKTDPEDFDEERDCLPYGMPYQMLLVAQYPFEIIQTKDRVTMIFELHNDVRRIYVDGRAIPSGLRSTWFGYSTGRWDGDTLSITTKAVRDGSMTRPHGPNMVITERLHMIADHEGKPMLVDEMTIDDPGTYSAPFTVKNYFRQHAGLEVGEYFCSEDLWQRNLSGEDTDIPWR